MSAAKTTNYADLVINLRHHEGDSYALDMPLNWPGSEAETQLLQPAAIISLDVAALGRYLPHTKSYGQALSEALFGGPDDGPTGPVEARERWRVREAFNKARAKVEGSLRVRLFIEAAAARLQALRWETLRDPDDPDKTLFAGERYCFSRYLESQDLRSVTPRTQEQLKALLVIADPLDLAGLARVDVAGELARARAGLGDIPLTSLASGGQATLERMQQTLRDGYDILYLVCHGALIAGEALLYLEDERQGAGRSAGMSWWPI